MTLANQEKQVLINLANTARQRAYAPYSKYHVGAALRTKTGRIFTGVNIENAAATDNGGSPCGGCRQVLAEFGLDTIVLIANDNGELLKEMTVKELLPEAFTPEKLDR